MTYINFDPAGGIIKKEIIELPELKKQKCIKEIKKILCSLFNHNINQIILGNNETSTLHHILNYLNINNASLITTNHEYISIVRMLEGKDVGKYVTRPSSNLKAGIPMPKKSFVKDKIILDYKNLKQFKQNIATKTKNKSNQILILVSHVSRITGEIFPIQDIYNYIKKLNQQREPNKKIYFVVDGAQSVFTFPIEPQKCSHIYLGTSSKALGAEPTVGFAFININQKIPDSILSSKRALNSFYQLLKNFYNNEKKIYFLYKKTKNQIKKIFQNLGYWIQDRKKVSPYILAVDHPDAEGIKDFLRKKNIIIANSADPTYTISDFKPKIRISWRDDISKNCIDKLGLHLAEAFSLSKLNSQKILSKLFKENGILFVDASKLGGSVYGYSKPLAISILQTIAKRNNIKSSFVSVDNIPRKDNQEKANNLLKKSKKFGILAISSSSPGHARIIDILSRLRIKSLLNDCIVLKGGSHETEAAEILQKDIGYPIDFSFIGEADKSFDNFLKLLKKNYYLKNTKIISTEKKLRKLNGIHYKNNETTPKKQFVEPKNFVIPMFDFLETEKPYALLDHLKINSMLRIMTMRGCAFGCIFCAITKNCRRISPKNTLDYLKYLTNYAKKKEIPIKQIFFEDATFTIEEKLKRMVNWSRKFADLLKKENIKISFGIQTRIDCLNEEIIKILADVGLKSVYLGVESLSDKQLKSFIKGYLIESKLKELIHLVEVLKKHNIGISVSLIWIPGEDKFLINTIEFLMKLGIDEIFVEGYKIYPGTGLSLKYGKERIIEMYNRGITKIDSPNPEDRNCLILDSRGNIHTKFDCSKIYDKIRELIKNSNYREINAGHYGIKEKMQYKDFLSFSKHYLSTNPK